MMNYSIVGENQDICQLNGPINSFNDFKKRIREKFSYLSNQNFLIYYILDNDQINIESDSDLSLAFELHSSLGMSFNIELLKATPNSEELNQKEDALIKLLGKEKELRIKKKEEESFKPSSSSSRRNLNPQQIEKNEEDKLRLMLSNKFEEHKQRIIEALIKEFKANELNETMESQQGSKLICSRCNKIGKSPYYLCTGTSKLLCCECEDEIGDNHPYQFMKIKPNMKDAKLTELLKEGPALFNSRLLLNDSSPLKQDKDYRFDCGIEESVILLEDLYKKR